MKSIFPDGMVFICPPGPDVKRGRPPLNGVRAMTNAERMRRRREKIIAGKPPIAHRSGPSPGLIQGPLTTQVSNDSFVRRFIDASFPNLSVVACACNRDLRKRGLLELKRVHEYPVVAMLVGTAIDYRIRAYFRRDVHRSSIVKRGLFFLQDHEEFSAKRLIASFEKFIKKVRPERRRLHQRSEKQLCRYCVIFAYLDFIGRAPFTNSAFEIMVSIGTPNIDKMLGRLDSAIVADVIGLSKIFTISILHYCRISEKRSSGKNSSAARMWVGPILICSLTGACLISKPHGNRTSHSRTSVSSSVIGF